MEWAYIQIASLLGLIAFVAYIAYADSKLNHVKH